MRATMCALERRESGVYVVEEEDGGRTVDRDAATAVLSPLMRCPARRARGINSKPRDN